MSPYNPNAPKLEAKSDFSIPNIREVFLVEFAEGVPIRELLMSVEDNDAVDDVPTIDGVETEPVGEIANDPILDEKFPTRPIASASGVRLHRVISPDHKTVTVYNESTNRTPLDFLTGPAFFATTNPGEVYGWTVIAVTGANPERTLTEIQGVRSATPDETDILNEMYPGWLESCRVFDAIAAEEAANLKLRNDVLITGAPIIATEPIVVE